MIATVQNTSRKVNYKGTAVEVWEARAQNGARFHLFVLGTALIPGQQVSFSAKEGQTAKQAKAEAEEKFENDFRDQLADQKIPAAETAALADSVNA